MRWEQFLDLLTVAEVMLFIFGRLLMSGSASAPGGARGPDMHSEVSGAGKKTKKKTCAMSPDWWCSLTQLYFTISLVGLGADHSLFLNPSP